MEWIWDRKTRMPKQFFTEKDIEDLFARGISSLEVNDNIILTQLAYEKAGRLGVKLIRQNPDLPPGSPVRPYISQKPFSTVTIAPSPERGVTTPTPSSLTPVLNPPAPVAEPISDGPDLHQRIHSAVIARLGSQIDPILLDGIINRVLKATGQR